MSYRNRINKGMSLILAIALMLSMFITGTPMVSAENEDMTGTLITSEGAAKASIVISTDASEVEQYAAKELQYHVEKVSGARLDINEGIVDETKFRAVFQTESVVAAKEGSYPVEILLINPTESTIEVSILQQDATENVVLTYRGTDSVDGTITVGAKKVVTVSGEFYVKDPYAFNEYELLVKLVNSKDNTELGTAVLKVAGPAKASLVTGDFEKGLGSWGINPKNCKGEVSEAEKRSGEKALYLYARNEKQTNQGGSYQSALELKPSTSYTVSYWAKAADETEATFGFQIGKVTNGKVEYIVNPKEAIQSDLTADWKRFEQTFTTDEDEAKWVNVILYFYRGNGALYLDDFTIVENALSESEMAEPVVSDFVPNDKTSIIIATVDTMPELNTLFSDDIKYLKELEVADEDGTKRYGEDGFAIREKDGVIYIFGVTAGGALNGVYDFIEENMGVLWTRADEDLGLIYTTNPTITANKVNYHEKSPFAVRGWHLCGTGDGGAHTDKATEIMMSRNKLNAELAEPQDEAQWEWKMGIGIAPFHLTHNVDDLITGSPVYDPTYEGYWNTDAEGKHYMPDSTDRKPNANQINYWDQGKNGYDSGANAKTLQTVIASVKEFLEDNPTMKYVGIGVNDTSYCTQYPEDTQAFEYASGKFVQPTDVNYKSTVCFSFINKVAKAVKAVYPDRDVTINAFAYSFTQIPPACEIEDNVCLVFAPINEDVTDAINTEEASPNNKDRADLEAWKQKTNNIVVYNYYGSFKASSKYERPIAELKIQKDLQHYAEQGLTGLIPEGLVDARDTTKNWDMNALTFWLYSKLAWNPDENVSELVKEFCDKSYGAASDYMQEYYDYVKQGWVKGAQKDGVSVRYNTHLNFYLENFVMNSGYVDKMQTALENAYNAADDIGKQRIQYIKDTFEENKTVWEQTPVKEEAFATKTTAGKEAVLATVQEADPFAHEIWANAKVLEQFLNPTSMKPLEGAGMKVRLLWDEEYLYVGYENFDTSIDDIVTSDLKGGWFAGGCEDIETYLAADPNGKMYNYITSPENVAFRWYLENGVQMYDASEADWDSVARIINVEDVSHDRYIIIQAISFDSIGIKAPINTETKVYGYFFRTYDGGLDAEGKGDASKLVSWNAAPVWETGYLRQITLSNQSSVSNVAISLLIISGVFVMAGLGIAVWFIRKKGHTK